MEERRRGEEGGRRTGNERLREAGGELWNSWIRTTQVRDRDRHERDYRQARATNANDLQRVIVNVLHKLLCPL